MTNPLTYFEALIVIIATAYTGFIYGAMFELRAKKNAKIKSEARGITYERMDGIRKIK